MWRLKVGKSLEAIVDQEDFEKVSKFKWSITKSNDKPYATARVSKFKDSRGRRKMLYMHRFIMGLDVGDPQIIDHENHNTLDNRKFNLRLCNDQLNAMNRIVSKVNRHGFKGIRKGRGDMWRAVINVNGKYKSLGSFENKIIAAQAYDKAAIKYFGQFAKTNKALNLYVEN